jgi:hypothetical protein
VVPAPIVCNTHLPGWYYRQYLATPSVEIRRIPAGGCVAAPAAVSHTLLTSVRILKSLRGDVVCAQLSVL